MFSILAPGKRIPPHTARTRACCGTTSACVVPEAPVEQRRHPRGRRDRGVVARARASCSTTRYQHEAWNDTDETRVVLFLDVVRPLRQPMRTINAAMIKAIGYSPFIQDAKRRHRDWERRYAEQYG